MAARLYTAPPRYRSEANSLRVDTAPCADRSDGFTILGLSRPTSAGPRRPWGPNGWPQSVARCGSWLRRVGVSVPPVPRAFSLGEKSPGMSKERSFGVDIRPIRRSSITHDPQGSSGLEPDEPGREVPSDRIPSAAAPPPGPGLAPLTVCGPRLAFHHATAAGRSSSIGIHPTPVGAVSRRSPICKSAQSFRTRLFGSPRPRPISRPHPLLNDAMQRPGHMHRRCIRVRQNSLPEMSLGSASEPPALRYPKLRVKMFVDKI